MMLFAVFLNPILLWGSLAVAIPIALHFFFRSRYRTLPWAAMKFLLAAIEQTSRRLKFQELLLLATRCLVLALLALALAQYVPQVASSGSGDGVDAVFLIDTSYSMAAKEGTGTRLDAARAAALKVLDQLPQHSTVQIVTCSDRATLAGPRLPGDLESARDILQSLTLSSQASDLYPGVVKAAQALEHGLSTGKELYVFSDMQASAWKKQAASLAKAFEPHQDKTPIFLIRCGTQKVSNVAITGIASQAPVPRPGERAGFSILLRNTGTETLEKLRVGLFINGREPAIEQFLAGSKEGETETKDLETAALDAVAPGETRTVTLTGMIPTPGLHVLTACVLSDDLPADNRFDQVLDVRDQVQLLVVDGGIDSRDPEKSSSFHLMHAMVPVQEGDLAKYHLVPKLVSPRLASPAELDRSALCILVNVPLPKEGGLRKGDELPDDFAEALARFVRAGKSAIIFAGDHVQAEAYNRILGKKHGLLPFAIRGLIERPTEQALSLNRRSANLPAYLRFKDEATYRFLDGVAVMKALDLDEPLERRARDAASLSGKPQEAVDDPVTVALRYDSGAPAVAIRKVGAGEVVLITTSADQGVNKETGAASWNYFAKLWGRVYVPFVQTTLGHLLQQQTRAHNLVSGETLSWAARDKEARFHTLLRPDGKEERLGLPENVQGQPMVVAKDLPVAGIYRLKSTGMSAKDVAVELPVAVVPDASESADLDSLTPTELDRLLGFRPIHLTAGAGEQAQPIERHATAWTRWLLLATLALALFEAGLAYWCGRAW